MKKLSMKFLMMTGLMVAIFFSCNNDDDDTASPAAPTFSSPPADVSVEVGEAEDVTYSVNTPGRYTTATVASSDDAVATATVKTQAAANSTTGSVVVTVTGVAAGSATITLTVNDGEGQRATDELGVTVEEEDTETPDGPATVGDTLGDIENLSTLAVAVDRAGLKDDLNGDGPFTIFAPNNAAFVALLESFDLEDDDLDGLIDALTEEGLAGVLRAHVVAGSLGATEVTAAAGAEALETLNEDATITVTQVGDSLFVNGAGILRANIEVGNGVIHVIDSVINTDIETDGGGEDVIVPDQSQVGEDDAARDVALELIDNFNAIQDVGVSLTSPIPSTNLNFVTNQLAELPDGDFFDEVDYKGAFDPEGDNWLEGWSLLSRGGYLGGTASGAAAYNTSELGADNVNLVTLPNTVSGDYSMTADKIYRIDGYTFVEDGELTIAAGTRIIAETDPSNNDPVSALIVTRSATINAQGTAESPIIMTSENDNESATLDENSPGEWGGLVILGTARVNKEGNTDLQIEGIPTRIPALYGAAGGNFDNERSSGTLRYISIRYTGDEIASGNELQGLTLGGVGSGTTIEYVESFASSDDGIEIFGGSPNIKYFAVGFAEDDSYDFDLGFNGSIQFAYALQGQSADNLIEWDGADDDNNAVFSDPTLYNMTLVSTAIADQALVLRDNTAGVLANSIIVADGTRGIVVENLPDSEDDSYQRLVDGEIELLNNLWYLGDTFTQFNSTASGIVQTVVPD